VKVLITGGAGYIGSTIASACADAGIQPVILDDLSTGVREFGERFPFYEGDYGDPTLVARVFAQHPDIHAVVHCAAAIIVPESVAEPLRYYDNNVSRFTSFLAGMIRHGCTRILFSSTASLYQPDGGTVVDEQSPVLPLSPYAASKWMVERILTDTAAAGDVAAVTLRYFNPVGADPQLRTGQQTEHGSHVLGRLVAAHDDGTAFTVTGTHWPTRDGSGLRDYIHVWDLALAHVAALQRFDAVLESGTTGAGYDVINLGTGRGTTVLELVTAFNDVVADSVPVVLGPPRPGDVAGACAAADKAARKLGWRAERTITQAIADALAWEARRAEVLPR
jgi:UDP-glucose 4-epimerase